MSSTNQSPTSHKHRKHKATRAAMKREATLMGTANTQRFLVRQGWVAAVSGFSQFSRQSNPQVDRVTLNILDKKTGAGGHFGLTGRPARLVRPRTSTEIRKLKNPGVQQYISRHAQRRLTKTASPIGSAPAYLVHVPSWDHASEVLKALAYVTCIPVGQRVAFTLRLTPAVVHRALLSPKGVAGYLQHRVAAKLRASIPEDLLDFMMVLETTGDGWGPPEQLGLHIHGVVVSTAGTPDVVKAALRRAAGKSENRRQARILAMRSALHPLGWIAYIFKQRLSTSQAILNAQAYLKTRPGNNPVPVLGATANLRNQARHWFNSYRESEDLIYLHRKNGIRPAS